jgi:hypothetical protein
MANKWKVKRSSEPGKAPSLADLELGELALNTHDGRLFTRKDDGTPSVVELSGGSGGGGGGGASFGLVIGDERTQGDLADISAEGGGDVLTILGLGGAKVRTEEATDTIYIDSRAVAMAIALG